MVKPIYYANALTDRPMIRPSDQVHAIGVAFGPGLVGLSAGMALPCGPWIEHDLGGVEQTWQLIVGGHTVAGWFALRHGAFYPVDVGQGGES
jgi:hypothetical protein